MAKQISLTFKENDRELELFNWLQSKVSKGSFIKEQLLIAMHNERNGIAPSVPQYEAPKTENNSNDDDRPDINLDLDLESIEEL